MKIREDITVSDNGFLFDVSTGESYSLNETAREIIACFREGKSEAEVQKYLEANYDAEPMIIENNIFEFTNLLRYLHLTEQ